MARLVSAGNISSSSSSNRKSSKGYNNNGGGSQQHHSNHNPNHNNNNNTPNTASSSKNNNNITHSSVAQRAMAFNDDAEEKRRRRSSIRPILDSRRQSIAALNRDTINRASKESSPAISTPTTSRVPIMANFEEWMKLVKDNKINANNSWNFALIDYFHDMSVLKEGDGINFQKASFTLDGCVKIYTSRVDSVASETGKLLSGLADGGKGNKGGNNGEDGNEEGDDDNDNNDDDGDDNDGENGSGTGSKKKNRRRHRSEATLAKNFSQIQVKKLELELAVDPLFRKMCADFNEGGAHSLLLNSLGIDGTGRVVFDGQADSQSENNHQDNNNSLSLSSTSNNTGSATEVEPESQIKYQNENSKPVDLNSIREKFFPDIEGIDSLSICPSLPMLEEVVKDPSTAAGNSITKDMETLRLEQTDDPYEIVDGEVLKYTGQGPTYDDDGAFNDFGGGGESFDDGYGGDDAGGDTFGAFGLLDPAVDNNEGVLEFGEPQVAASSMVSGITNTTATGINSGEPGNEIETTNTITNTGGNSLQVGFGSGTNGNNGVDIMAYFDESLKSNWAGPEHWKIKKVKMLIGLTENKSQLKDGQTTTDGEKGENGEEEVDGSATSSTTTTGTKKRTVKEPFVIDFLSPEADVDDNDIFTQGSSTISLARNQRKTKTKNLLPVDVHFSSKELIRVFLKPKAKLFRKERELDQDSQQQQHGFNRSIHMIGNGDGETGTTGLSASAAGDDVDENFFAQNMNEEGRADIQPDFGEAAFAPDARDNDDDDDNGGYYDDDDGDYGPDLPMDFGAANFENGRTIGDAMRDGLLSSQMNSGLSGNGNSNANGNANGLAPPGFLLGNKRTRPEYVSYAKSAKKVNVKLLKDNIWKVLDIPEREDNEDEEDNNNRNEKEKEITDNNNNGTQKGGGQDDNEEERKFSEIMHGLQGVYPLRELNEISTSFCFISLLHLANEKGLILGNNEEYTDITIKKDTSVRKEQLSA